MRHTLALTSSDPGLLFVPSLTAARGGGEMVSTRRGGFDTAREGEGVATSEAGRGVGLTLDEASGGAGVTLDGAGGGAGVRRRELVMGEPSLACKNLESIAAGL